MRARFLLPPDSGWSDVSEQLHEDAPLTLAKSDGLGVLQVTDAEHVAGPEPGTDADALGSMLQGFGRRAALGEMQDLHIEMGPPLIAAASFLGESFVRVWHLSDGTHLALATYTCALENAAGNEELPECESIVRTVRFR